MKRMSLLVVVVVALGLLLPFAESLQATLAPTCEALIGAPCLHEGAKYTCTYRTGGTATLQCIQGIWYPISLPPVEP